MSETRLPALTSLVLQDDFGLDGSFVVRTSKKGMEFSISDPKRGTTASITVKADSAGNIQNIQHFLEFVQSGLNALKESQNV